MVRDFMRVLAHSTVVNAVRFMVGEQKKDG